MTASMRVQMTVRTMDWSLGLQKESYWGCKMVMHLVIQKDFLKEMHLANPTDWSWGLRSLWELQTARY
jgi:hypothetical protein